MIITTSTVSGRHGIVQEGDRVYAFSVMNFGAGDGVSLSVILSDGIKSRPVQERHKLALKAAVLAAYLARRKA